MPEPVVLLLDARVGHGGHPGPLLREAKELRGGPGAAGFDGLRARVVGTAVSGERGENTYQIIKLLKILSRLSSVRKKLKGV